MSKKLNILISPENEEICVRKGQQVNKNEPLTRPLHVSGSTKLAPFDGIVKNVSKHEINFELCEHGTLYGCLCVVCGKNMSDELEKRETFNPLHTASMLQVDEREMKKLAQTHHEQLTREKKLILVVDLDQTIVHATNDRSIENWFSDKENPNHEYSKDIHQFTLSDDPYNIYYVKLRPNALEFIKEVSKKYELHIYTMGTRAYAHKIANILDKEYKYFQQRILSRDDSGSFTQKALHRLFPFDVSKVVIIDDREDVWNGSPNLIPVKPYFFFEGIGDINAPEKLAGNENPDLDANQIKQAKLKDDDTELSNNILRILNKVHSQFYNSKSDTVSVMDILTEMKENVLKKCNIAFSSIIPLEIQPERSRVWKLVETFGGNCFKQISKDLTHLVSKNSKTAKVAEARKLGNIHVVDIEWLFSSVYSFRRQDEKLFHHFKPMNIPQNDEIIPLSATEAHSWEDQGENLMSVVSEIDETALAKLQSLSDEESTDQEFSTREIDSFQNDIYEGDHDDSDDPNDQTSDGYEEGGRNHSKRKRDSSFTGTFQDNTIDGWSHPEEEWIDLGESLEEELLRDLEEN